MSRNPRPPPVVPDMSARAHVVCALLALLLPIYAHGEEIICTEDGLFPDYETECSEYVRCAGGAVAARYACGAGRQFSAAAGACVRQRACVRRACAPGDDAAYAAPGTACRHYYRCRNGTAVERACPPGAWFDAERQACARGAGTCFEPLCTGLPDGRHQDPSHGCRRELLCAGGELSCVASCPGGQCGRGACPPPRSAAVPLPAGDADFCPDEACASLCERADDGTYADRSSGCREYFVCRERRVVSRGVCEAGRLFAGGGCAAAARAVCPPPARGPCYNRPDGRHRDWRDCGTWFQCRSERVAARGACEPGLVFDGAECVPRSSFGCEGPAPAALCEGLPSGTYQDLASNCTSYYRCEGAMKTTLWCGAGRVFDGARCVGAAAYACPAAGRGACAERGPGRLRAPGAGCRGFVQCARGEPAHYACAPGHVFNGDACVPAADAHCDDDYSCRALADGYHAEIESGCRSYFYCEGGDRLATLSCQAGKVFDGHACVERARHECGAAPLGSTGRGRCERDGFFTLQHSKCKKYYFCLSGEPTHLACDPGHVFNGHICVSERHYTCPG